MLFLNIQVYSINVYYNIKLGSLATMESMKFLFNKIKLRIRSNPLFSANIYYPFSQHIKDFPTIWINLDDDDRIYVCAYIFVTRFGEAIDYELTKEFLAPYNYHIVLRTKYSAHAYKVIYELSL